MPYTEIEKELLRHRKQIRWLWAIIVILSLVVWFRLSVLEARADGNDLARQNLQVIRKELELFRKQWDDYLKGKSGPPQVPVVPAIESEDK